MAIYHLTAKIIKRSEGRSAVAAAAYRSGDTLTNEYDGRIHDYSRKGWIEHNEILLPSNAPERLKDRSTLWNEVEQIEQSSNSQLAREIELALPNELSPEERLNLLHEFIEINFLSKGMCVDAAIHNPPVRDEKNRPVDKDGNPTTRREDMIFRNVHAHLMSPMRPLDAAGNWAMKYEKCYLCRKENKEEKIPVSQIREAEAEGWKKQYRYKIGKKTVWLTADTAKKEGLKRVDKQPKTVNIPNPLVAYWNSKDTLMEWRKSWAELCNQYYEKNHIEARIDHRSYAEQGIDRISTVHMGVQAYQMEKKGIRTELGDLNREIKKDNEFLSGFQKQMERMEQKEMELLNRTAAHLEGLRARYTVCAYHQLILSASLADEHNQEETERMTASAMAESAKQTAEFLESLMKAQEQKQIEMQHTNPVYVQKKRKLKEEILENEIRIQELKQKMDELKEKKKLLKTEPVSDPEVLKEQKKRIASLRNSQSQIYKEFYLLVEENKENMEKLKEVMKQKRITYERQTEETLKEHCVGQFQKKALAQAQKQAPDLPEDTSHGIQQKISHKR